MTLSLTRERVQAACKDVLGSGIRFCANAFGAA